MRRKLSRRRSSKGSEDGGSVQEDAASAPARPPAAPGATVVQTSGPIDYEVRFGVGLLGMTLARRGGSVIVNELPHAKHLANPRSGADNIQKGDAVVVVNGHPIEFPSSITMVEEKFRHAQAAGKPYLVKFRRSHGFRTWRFSWRLVAAARNDAQALSRSNHARLQYNGGV